MNAPVFPEPTSTWAVYRDGARIGQLVLPSSADVVAAVAYQFGDNAVPLLDPYAADRRVPTSHCIEDMDPQSHKAAPSRDAFNAWR